MKYLYTAMFTPSEDGSCYFARVPDLPGCVTTGSTLLDAIAQITDAASGWLCVAEDEGFEIPEPSEQASLDHPEGAVFSLLQLDTVAYRAATDTRAVRKSVSIPQWMATLADRRGINCSKVLQDGLRRVFEA